MIKRNQGITLITLAITVLILFILIGTGTTAVYTSINEVKDNKLSVELGIVRQAVTQQYSMAATVGKTKVLASKEPVSFWVGERINSSDVIYVPTEESINPEDQNAQIFINRIENYHPQYQEDFYYRLNMKQLQEIGIGTGMNETTHTYIVNYSTGEVYNETKKVNSEGNLLYMPSTVYDLDAREGT